MAEPLIGESEIRFLAVIGGAFMVFTLTAFVVGTVLNLADWLRGVKR